MQINATAYPYTIQAFSTIQSNNRSNANPISDDKQDSTINPQSSGGLDFTQMTPKQLQNSINDLIESGQMSLDESSALIGMVPTTLSKVNYDGQIPAAYEQPINVIQRLQDGIAGADSRHDTATSEFLSRSLCLTKIAK